MDEPSVILPAEYVGEARHSEDGWLEIGTADENGVGVVRINLSRTGIDPKGYAGWWSSNTVGVYVRRLSDDLSVCEIAMSRHDGLSQEALDEENRQAEIYPLGPKEYWRGQMVGKYTTQGGDPTAPRRLMTNEDFEAEWGED